MEKEPAINAEIEADRISFVGQTVALRITGVDVIEARLSSQNIPFLVVEDEELVAGFTDQQFGRQDLQQAVASRVAEAGPTMARRMAVAQVRAIYSGNAALDCADVTGVLGFTKADRWLANEEWAGGLLDTFADLLDVDSDTLECLGESLWAEAQKLIGRNWHLFISVYLSSRKPDQSFAESVALDPYFDKPRDFAVTSSYSQRLWAAAEREAALLDEEE